MLSRDVKIRSEDLVIEVTLSLFGSLNSFIWKHINSRSGVVMSRFKSLMISALSTIICILGFSLPVSARTLEPVGGVVTAANKLAIVAPYLVLAGLIIAVSAIVIKRRK